jgi:hypothetical protein
MRRIDDRQATGVRKRRRTQHRGVDEPERGRQRADRDGDHDGDGDRETRGAGHPAETHARLACAESGVERLKF